MRDLDEIRLTVEEAEALRLKELEKLEQKESAERMNISRPTFQRILSSARHKTADALLNGKVLRIQGGNFEITKQRLRCVNNHEWGIPDGIATTADLQFCPVCNEKAMVE